MDLNKNKMKELIDSWYEFRDEDISTLTCEEDRKHWIYIDEISEKILKNVPNKNKKYVKKQLEQLDHNFLDYICYWNKKTYLNGLQDGINLILFALVGDSYGS